MDLAFFRSAVPVSDTILDIMFAVGWALLLGNLVFQAAKSMMSGLGFEADDPRTLGLRSFVFAFLLMASREICAIGLSLGSTVVALLQVPSSVALPNITSRMFDAIGAGWLLSIIVGIIIIIQLVKFFFQVGERYVILAVLTILAPLAFSMGGSRNTSEIFKGWARMYGSMCLMMVLNVVFVKLIVSAMARTPHTLMAIPWLILIIALARVAKKIDGIVARIGLNPAVTSDGLGRSFPGLMTLMIGKYIASSIVNSKIGAGKVATGASAKTAAAASAGFAGRTNAETSPINTQQSTTNTAGGTTPGNPPVGMSGAGSVHQTAQQTTGRAQGQSPSARQPQAGSKHPPMYGGYGNRMGGSRRGGIPVVMDEPDLKPASAPSVNLVGRDAMKPIDALAGKPSATTERTAGAPNNPPIQRSTANSVSTQPVDTSRSEGGGKQADRPSVSPASSERSQSGQQSAVVHNSNMTPIHTQVNAQTTQKGSTVQSNAYTSQQGAQSQVNVQSAQQGAGKQNTPSGQRSQSPSSRSVSETQTPTPVQSKSGQAAANKGKQSVSTKPVEGTKAAGTPGKDAKPLQTGTDKSRKPITAPQGSQPVQGKPLGAKGSHTPEPIDVNPNFQKQLAQEVEATAPNEATGVGEQNE
jgi:hypothetical protein